MTKRVFILTDSFVRGRAIEAVRTCEQGMVVEIKERTRSLDQNAAMWPLLDEIAKQVEWYGKKLTAANWKDVFTASLKRNEVVPGLDGGGFVVLGQSTSQMTKREFSELLELVHAFAAEKEVKLGDSISREREAYDQLVRA